MIIGIQKGLEEIREYISGYDNYEVVSLEDYKGFLNVMIYTEKMPDKEYEESQFELENKSLIYHGSIPQGILMINANNKTPEDIINLLKQNPFQ
ncbi:MAG: YkuS family protein [Cellulosilyticaceae bacterium]